VKNARSCLFRARFLKACAALFRLERFTKGSETTSRQLRRNAKGELGFHVNYEGIVMDVDPNECAFQDGVTQSSRLVEVKYAANWCVFSSGVVTSFASRAQWLPSPCSALGATYFWVVRRFLNDLSLK